MSRLCCKPVLFNYISSTYFWFSVYEMRIRFSICYLFFPTLNSFYFQYNVIKRFRIIKHLGFTICFVKNNFSFQKQNLPSINFYVFCTITKVLTKYKNSFHYSSLWEKKTMSQLEPHIIIYISSIKHPLETFNPTNFRRMKKKNEEPIDFLLCNYITNPTL